MLKVRDINVRPSLVAPASDAPWSRYQARPIHSWNTSCQSRAAFGLGRKSKRDQSNFAALKLHGAGTTSTPCLRKTPLARII